MNVYFALKKAKEENHALKQEKEELLKTIERNEIELESMWVRVETMKKKQ